MKALAMYILDFSIHTHTNYCWSTPEAGNQERFPSLKGSVRVDKASLTQYVNDSISEVNHVGTQMATGELLIFESRRDVSTGDPKVSISTVQ